MNRIINYFDGDSDIRIVGYIYETDNYEIFSKMASNRNVSPRRKEILKNSLTEHEILNPIVTNEKCEIADGQGRFDAKRDLGRPIQFVVSYGSSIEDCRRINKCNTPWVMLDYMYSYADDGNENYIKLRDCYEETHIPLNRILRFTNKGSAAGDRLLENGNIKFSDKDYRTVIDINNKCNDILSALCFSARVNEAFYTGVKIVVETEGYNHNRMLENCKKNRSSYTQMARLIDQLKEFTRIYNFHSKNNKIYFEDYMRNKGYAVRDYKNKFHEYTRDDVSTLKRTEVDD